MEIPNPFTVVALHADTRSTGRCFVRNSPPGLWLNQPSIESHPGPKLDAITAEKVFGWKNVHKHDGQLVGKRQDKAGHWRRAKVPNYSGNPFHAYAIEDRMKQLGRLDRYQKELARITHANDIPSDWASPDQRCRAAIKAVGQYGKVVPFRKSGDE